MKIAVVDPSYFTLCYDSHLCSALSAHGHQVTLVGRKLRPGEWLPHDRFLADAHFYRFSEAVRFPALKKKLIARVKGAEHIANMATCLMKLRKLRPDIIHFQWLPLPMIDLFFISQMRKIAPVLLTVHDTNPFHGHPTHRLQLEGWGKSLSAFDQLVVHTEFSKAKLVDMGVDPLSIQVVPHGVLRVDEVEPQKRPPFTNGEAVILCFGEIKPYKGIDVLFRAFALLPDAVRRRAKIRIVGRPRMNLDSLTTLSREISIADRVEWDLRFVPEEEIPEVFANADILAFPYRDIDASGVLMMSLPFAKPIVASNVGGFSEILQDGDNAVLSPVEDHESLAAGMLRLLTDGDYSSRLSQKCVELSDTKFSWRHIAEMTTGVYQSLMTGATYG